MVPQTFKRYEIKYLLNCEQYESLKELLSQHLVKDPYCRESGSYMIYNLYFDTDQDEIIRRSMSKPYYKEKLRLRSYQAPVTKNQTVFLELKKKIGGTVAKRRAAMTYSDAMRFTKWGIPPETKSYLDQQVTDEIREFLSRYPAKPKVYISYCRTAYFDPDNRNFRISFDQEIRTRRNHVNFQEGNFGSELLERDSCLMEIKLSSQIPLWLCHSLSSMGIHRTGFSKYGTEYRKHT